MSEVEGAKQEDSGATGVQSLDSLYAYKLGMSSVYDEEGRAIPVTVLKYEPLVVTQIKSKEKDGYVAVQVASRPKRDSRTSKAEKSRLTKAGFENGALMMREIRQDQLPEGIKIGDKIALESLSKGDTVKATSLSKGRGFAGVMKRWNFAGGPGSHGAGFGRRPGSVGNRTWPGRVMPGKRFPGHFGNETTTVKNLKIVDVVPEDKVLLVKGAVPGARNTLVKLSKI